MLWIGFTEDISWGIDNFIYCNLNVDNEVVQTSLIRNEIAPSKWLQFGIKFNY